MKERPILFSGPMVLAIKEGRKTQTRRVVKPQPEMVMDGEICNDGSGGYSWEPVWPEGHKKAGKFMGWNDCPYGKPGDRLYVRERHARIPGMEGMHAVHYFADGPMPTIEQRHDAGLLRSCPSIHMPRWASRITLEIVAVRVERLNAISNTDILREGIRSESCNVCVHTGGSGCDHCFSIWNPFRNLWESINGPGSWEKNPFVWVIEFRRIEP